MFTERFPCRTVYAHVVHLDGEWLGYAAFEDSFSTWTVAEVHDAGVTRHFTPLVADLPDRETAEDHALALVAAHTRIGAAA